MNEETKYYYDVEEMKRQYSEGAWTGAGITAFLMFLIFGWIWVYTGGCLC